MRIAGASARKLMLGAFAALAASILLLTCMCAIWAHRQGLLTRDGPLFGRVQAAGEVLDLSTEECEGLIPLVLYPGARKYGFVYVPALRAGEYAFYFVLGTDDDPAAVREWYLRELAQYGARVLRDDATAGRAKGDTVIGVFLRGQLASVGIEKAARASRMPPFEPIGVPSAGHTETRITLIIPLVPRGK